MPFEDGEYRIEIDIGADFPIQCLVMKDWLNPPWFLRELSSAILAESRTVGARSVELVGIDADAVEDALYMGVEWNLIVSTWLGDGPISFHLLYAVKQDASIACTKHEIGYRETYLRVFRALVANFERSDPPPAPDFSEITVASIGGRPIGIVTETSIHDEEGDEKDEVRMHTLVPSSPDSLHASSVYQTEWVDGRDRSLLVAYRKVFENDEDVADLELRRSQEDDRWVVKGVHRGASIESTVGEGEDPTSQLQLVANMREALEASDPAGQLTSTWVWSADDPTRLSEFTIRVDGVIDPEHARTTTVVGSTTMESIVERKTGRAVSGTMRVAERRIDLKRVHVAGTRQGDLLERTSNPNDRPSPAQ